MAQDKLIYCVVTGDLFHHGHVRFFKRARELGDQLIVGVCSDEDVSQYKRTPIMTLEERCELIESCRYVDKVVPDAPAYVSAQWIDKHHIDKVVTVDNYTPEQISTYFRHPRDMGKLVILPYTDGISTSELILRCHTAVLEENALDTQLKIESENLLTPSNHSHLSLCQALNETGFLSPHSKPIAKTVAASLNPQSGQQFLDLNCGGGGIGFYFHEQYQLNVKLKSQIPECIALTNENHSQLISTHSTFQVEQADSNQNSETDQFDIIWLDLVLSQTFNKQSIFTDLTKILKPNASIVIIDFCETEIEVDRSFIDYLYQHNLVPPSKNSIIEFAGQIGLSLKEERDLSSHFRTLKAAELDNLNQLQSDDSQLYSDELLEQTHTRLTHELDYLKRGFCEPRLFIFQYKT